MGCDSWGSAGQHWVHARGIKSVGSVADTAVLGTPAPHLTTLSLIAPWISLFVPSFNRCTELTAQMLGRQGGPRKAAGQREDRPRGTPRNPAAREATPKVPPFSLPAPPHPADQHADHWPLSSTPPPPTATLGSGQGPQVSPAGFRTQPGAHPAASLRGRRCWRFLTCAVGTLPGSPPTNYETLKGCDPVVFKRAPQEMLAG